MEPALAKTGQISFLGGSNEKRQKALTTFQLSVSDEHLGPPSCRLNDIGDHEAKTKGIDVQPDHNAHCRHSPHARRC